MRTPHIITKIATDTPAATATDDAGKMIVLGTDGHVANGFLDVDLEALGNNSTNGLLTRTGAGTVAARTLTGPAAGITVSNGDGVSGNPTLALANDLAAYEGLSTTGLVTRTGDGTATTRTLTAPAAGITVTDGSGVAGNPTLVLANDLAAYEGLSTTGVVVRTGDGAATTRAITGTAGSVTVTNGDGVSGAPTISLDATLAALAAANWVANAIPIGSGADTLSQVTFAANTFPARASTGNLVAKTITDGALAFLASPGSDTQVIFNDGGTPSGDADFTYNKTTGELSVGRIELAPTITTPDLSDLFNGVFSYDDSGGDDPTNPFESFTEIRNYNTNGADWYWLRVGYRGEPYLEFSGFEVWHAGNLLNIGTTAASARTALGATTVGAALFTAANPGALTFVRVNADNSVTFRSASDFRTDLGLGTMATQNANAVAITGGTITGITDLAVADGGTGASTAAAARTNLGATTLGGNLFTLTNPGAITFPRFNADNTATARSAADFRTDIGVPDGTYTPTLTGVTNVAGTTSAVCNYMRVGDTVTVSGLIQIDPTAASIDTEIAISLPIASNFAATSQLGGAGAALGHAMSACVFADTANDRARFYFVCGASHANAFWSFQFTYRVI